MLKKTSLQLLWRKRRKIARKLLE